MSKQRALTISDAFDLFLLDAQARGLASSTINTYKIKVRPFLDWCEAEGIEPLCAVTPIHLRRFLVYLQRQPFSSRYRYNIAKATKTFFNYCVSDELIEVSPFAKVKTPRLEKKILPALTPDELKAVLKACSSIRDQTICTFLLDSGVRASELVALNGEDIELRTGAVTVKQGKGHKDRVTYVGAKTRKLLRRYYMERGIPHTKEPVFVSATSGQRLTLFGLAQLMERLRVRSGVSNCTCHTFRRTFALSCLRNGMNVYVLARLMGHSDITVLRHYLALVEHDLANAHERYGPADNML